MMAGERLAGRPAVAVRATPHSTSYSYSTCAVREPIKEQSAHTHSYSKCRAPCSLPSTRRPRLPRSCRQRAARSCCSQPMRSNRSTSWTTRCSRWAPAWAARARRHSATGPSSTYTCTQHIAHESAQLRQFQFQRTLFWQRATAAHWMLSASCPPLRSPGSTSGCTSHRSITPCCGSEIAVGSSAYLASSAAGNELLRLQLTLPPRRYPPLLPHEPWLVRKLSVTSDVAHNVDELCDCAAATSALTACTIGSAHELQMLNVLDVACIRSALRTAGRALWERQSHRGRRGRHGRAEERRKEEAHR